MVLLKAAKLTALVLVPSITACVMVGMLTSEPVGPHFSHAIHDEEEGLHCITCHSGVQSGASAGMPGPELCAPCHDKLDAEKEPSRRLSAFYDERSRYKVTRVATISSEVIFSHQYHARLDVECADCHGDVGQSDVIPRESAVSKDDCMSCHSRAGLQNACAECHTEIDEQWSPPNHAHAWDRFHGDVVRARDQAIANRCSMCHKQSSCEACHQEVAPRNHNSFWRRRGHGISASIDRSRCATCHRTSETCERCHANTRPLSHTAGFGGSRLRHCTGCHLPLQGEGCITCHKDAPSHMLAAPLPPTHTPSLDCRTCHGAGVPLPHPDNGQSCIACHK